jgi:hypothetical protein
MSIKDRSSQLIQLLTWTKVAEQCCKGAQWFKLVEAIEDKKTIEETKMFFIQLLEVDCC